MRQAGTLSNRDDAQRLVDYLLTQGIITKTEPEGDAWAVWVREEDQLPQAIRELQEFRTDSQAPRYRHAADAASALRKQQSRDEQQRRKHLIEMRDRWDISSAGRRPLTLLLIVVCILVSLVTDFGQNDSAFLQNLWFQPRPTNLLQELSWTPTKYIQEGQVWRVVTPIFIHMSVLHLIFNMYWLYIFGSMIESRRGTLFFALFVLAIAVISNWGQYYFTYEVDWFHVPPTTQFGGMSGVGYGLFGYLWIKSRFDPHGGVFLPPNTVGLFLIWFALCWSGLLGPIANWAHTTGMASGMAISYVPVAWRKMTRE
jgi:GlpG protein